MQQLGVPLVSGIAEHETLITGTHLLLFVFLLVHRVRYIGILLLHILNDIAIVTIEADVVTSESHLVTHLACYLLIEYLKVGGLFVFVW